MLSNKHIVVVGGSSGLGLAAARQAHQEGARVTLVARTAERLQSVASSLNASAVVGDITSEVSTWASEIQGPIDHVYISAGSFVGGDYLDIDLDDYQSSVDETLWGPAKLVQALYERMNKEDASFVFTGGISTARPNPGAWATNISKAISDHMARSLAIELAPLRFNSVSPGFVETPMWNALSSQDRENYVSNFTEKTPLKRLATEQDVASAVLSLMRNKAITGQVLYVDGGYTFA